MAILQLNVTGKLHFMLDFLHKCTYYDHSQLNLLYIYTDSKLNVIGYQELK